MSHLPGDNPRETVKRGDHERSDANVLAVALLGLSVLVTVAAAQPVVDILFAWLDRREQARSPALSPLAGDQMPPPPRLEVSPPIDLLRFRADEERLLGQYAWLDRQQGIVRIPIDRAMELVLERGLPAPEHPRARNELLPPTPQVEPAGERGALPASETSRPGSPPGAVDVLPPDQRDL